MRRSRTLPSTRPASPDVTAPSRDREDPRGPAASRPALQQHDTSSELYRDPIAVALLFQGGTEHGKAGPSQLLPPPHLPGRWRGGAGRRGDSGSAQTAGGQGKGCGEPRRAMNYFKKIFITRPRLVRLAGLA